MAIENICDEELKGFINSIFMGILTLKEVADSLKASTDVVKDECMRILDES